MTGRASHLAKAGHNESLLKLVHQTGQFLDWDVTIIFYVAVHYVDAYLALQNIHPRAHRGSDGRNSFASSELSKEVSTKYLTLYAKSRYARYTPFSERNIDPRDVETMINWIDVYFKKL